MCTSSAMGGACFSCQVGDLFSVSEPAPTNVRCVRPFTISPKKVTLSSDSHLIRDQTLARTHRTKLNITSEKISISKLKTYVHNELPASVGSRTISNPQNTETTKIIQNLYITSFAGLQNVKTLKSHKINLFLNASIDLPIVEFHKIVAETLRVPVSILSSTPLG